MPRVQNGILDALDDHGALSSAALTILIFGSDFTHTDRASLDRAVRNLARQGKIETFHIHPPGMHAKIPGFDHTVALRDIVPTGWRKVDLEIRQLDDRYRQYVH
jgi:hypothetical protein